jgi:phosphate transport system protein
LSEEDGMTDDAQQTTDPADDRPVVSDEARNLPPEIRSIVSEVEGIQPEPGVPIRRGLLDREERMIKDGILRMGTQVVEAIRAASAALEHHDAEAALQVIKDDPFINELQRHVSGLILVTIATQQPVARDLRYLLTLDHVASELERMGDHAASVAKQVRHMAPEPPLRPSMRLTEMATLAADNLQGVLRALVDADSDMAREVARRDDDLDAMWHQTWDEVAELMREDPDNVNRGMRIMLAAHYLERIGDRTTNIAEDVVYLTTGEIEDLNP